MNSHLLNNALITEVATERGGNRPVADRRVEGSLNDGEQSRPNVLVSPCPWCGEPVERRVYGGHAKIFCDPDCKNAFNNGLAWLGKFLGRCANEPALLRAAIDNLANVASPSLTTPERATQPSRWSGRPKNEDGR